MHKLNLGRRALGLLRWTRLDREDGQVLPMFAAGLIAMMLMTGVVIDGGNLFQNRQSLQNAADAAAIAAAEYLSDPTMTCQAGAVDPIGACTGMYAGLNGVTNANGTVTTQLNQCPGTVTDTTPPLTAPGCYVYPYNTTQIEVWLTQTTSNFFGGLAGFATSTESARAVGTITAGNPPPITFAALDNSCDNHTLLIKLGGHLQVDSGIYVDSCSQGDGFDVFGGGSITAPKIETNGGWETHNASKVYVPAGTVCSFPPNKAPDWHIVGNPPTYSPTPAGCPDLNQTVIDPFAGFPPAPALGIGNIGPPMSIVKVSRGLNGDAANVARVVTASAHGLAVGDSVTISGVGTFGGGNFDGTYKITSVPNATTFTYANTGANVPSITQKQMTGGVATLTTNAPTTLNIGENDLTVSNLPGFNVAGGTVTNTNSTSFSYTPPPYIVSIGHKQLQSGTATLTLGGPGASTAGLDPGDTVTVLGVGPQFDGSQVIASVPTNTTFTFGDSATSTLTVTKKAAAHGVATLTAANSLSAGDTVTVNIGDPRFDGTYTVAANSPTTPLSGTQFSYTDTNLGTMDISPTNKVMAAGVATITVPNHLVNGEQVTVNFQDVNYAGGPYTVAGVTGNSFNYTPAVPVPLTSGSITNGVATVNTSVPHKLIAGDGDDVNVSGDDAFSGFASNVGLPSGTSFTYTPPPIANVAWNVTSATSATFTTAGTHDTNITSITITGTTKPYVDNTTFSGANLSVTPNGFTVTGTGFHAGDHGNAAKITINTATATTFSGALATQEIAWDLLSHSTGGTVTVPYFLAPTATGGTVTAPAVVANQASSGTATLTDVPLLPGSGLFMPAWMVASFGVVAKDLPGSAGLPVPTVISSGNVGLSPGTYFGGICIGAAAGSNCAGTNCKAVGGTTTTIQPYSPRIDLAADVPDNFDATGGIGTIQVTAAGISPGDLLAIDDEEMKVQPGGVNGTTITVMREANGTEGGPHSAGTQVFQVVTTQNAQAYTPAVTLNTGPPGLSVGTTTVPIKWGAGADPVGVQDVIQIDNEQMLVNSITAVAGGANLSVTRAYNSTTAATHANGAKVLQAASGSAGTAANVTLSPGVYIMAGGGFSICGAASVSATQGVLIYNTVDPGSPSGAGALGQVDINTAGNVHLGPMSSGPYAGLTIFQDRNQTLVPGTKCDAKSGNSTQWDIALQSAAPLPASGELGSVTGTIYAPHTRSDFGDSMSGTSNLAIITSCIYINGATATFTHNTGSGQLFGVSATLGG